MLDLEQVLEQSISTGVQSQACVGKIPWNLNMIVCKGVTLRYEPSNLEAGASFLMRFVKVVFPNFRSLRLREQARRS